MYLPVSQSLSFHLISLLTSSLGSTPLASDLGSAAFFTSSSTCINGLNDSSIIVIDASIGGALMKKTTDQAYGILEDMATNSN